MPDILIRGIEMPTGCASCDFAIYHADSAYHYCFWLKQVFVKPDARLKDCPLHELPEHGDLKDARQILEEIDDIWDGRPLAPIGAKVLAIIDSAPVIVPANKEESP